MMKRDQKGFSLVEGLLIVIALTLIGFAGWYVWQSNNKNNTNESTPSTSPKAQEVVGEGTITGPPSFPSEGIPEDLKVCAVSIGDSKKEYCDNVGEKQTKSDCNLGDENCTPPPLVNFSIKVPAGDYHVYAFVSSSPNQKAYYNEFSKCGNSVDCPASGHKKYIKVSVAANQVVENISPSDWYDF